MSEENVQYKSRHSKYEGKDSYRTNKMILFDNLTQI